MKVLFFLLCALLAIGEVRCCHTSATGPTTPVWNSRSTAGYTARLGAVQAVVDGKIYVIGGESGNYNFADKNEMYDPATNSWQQRSTVGFTPRCYAACAVVNGIIYVMGGIDSAPGSRELAVVEAYDPARDTWSSKSQAGFTPRSTFGAAAANGKIYAIGGRMNGGTKLCSAVEEYDPATDSWSPKSNVGFQARSHLDCAECNGKIYVPFGHILTAFVNTNQLYDPAADTWTTLASGGTNRYAVGVCSLNGKIYCIGGYDDITFFNTPMIYDPATNGWSAGNGSGFIPCATFEPMAVDSAIYAIGGNTTAIIVAVQTWVP